MYFLFQEIYEAFQHCFISAKNQRNNPEDGKNSNDTTFCSDEEFELGEQSPLNNQFKREYNYKMNPSNHNNDRSSQIRRKSRHMERRMTFSDTYVSFFDSHQGLVFAVFNILIYFSTAIIAYSFLFEDWTIIDSMYFGMCILTTIGYGDVTPTNDYSRLFTCFFALYGIYLLGAFVSLIGEKLVQMHHNAIHDFESRAKTRVASMILLNNNGSNNNNGDNNDYLQSTPNRKKRRSTLSKSLILPLGGGAGAMMRASAVRHSQMGQSFRMQKDEIENLANESLVRVFVKAFILQVPLIAVVMGCAVIMGQIQGWTVISSLYYGVVTSGTVGFGDLSPQGQVMRGISILLLPLMVGIFCEVLGRIAGAYMKHKVAQTEKDFLDRQLTVDDLVYMDTDKDGHVNFGEFLSFMLLAMQKVQEDDIDQIKDIFEKLDRTGDGLLDKDDLIAFEEEEGDDDDDDGMASI